jgi:hypothetical protein
MRTVEHYVMINGKVICELVGEDGMAVSRAGIGTESMDGSTSAVAFQNRALRDAPPVPATKENR